MFHLSECDNGVLIYSFTAQPQAPAAFKSRRLRLGGKRERGIRIRNQQTTGIRFMRKKPAAHKPSNQRSMNDQPLIFATRTHLNSARPMQHPEVQPAGSRENQSTLEEQSVRLPMAPERVLTSTTAK